MPPELDAVYEVFLQIGGEGRPIQLVGSVRASDERLAWQSAKEIYTRRENCTALWVVPRSALFVGEGIDLELLMRGLVESFVFRDTQAHIARTRRYWAHGGSVGHEYSSHCPRARR